MGSLIFLKLTQISYTIKGSKLSDRYSSFEVRRVRTPRIRPSESKKKHIILSRDRKKKAIIDRARVLKINNLCNSPANPPSKVLDWPGDPERYCIKRKVSDFELCRLPPVSLNWGCLDGGQSNGKAAY